jgi:membrane-associated phospholipid phosphatase
MKYNLIILTILFSYSSKSNAQITGEAFPNKNSGLFNNIKDDGLSFFNTSADVFTSPFNFDEEDYILSGIIVGATALSFTFDNPIRNNITSIKGKTFEKSLRYGEKFGNGIYVAGLSGAIYLSGHLIQDKELRKTGLMMAEAIFINGIITQGLKIIMGRSRPYRNTGNHDMDIFEIEFDDKENSFPSGHTSTAFTVATVLSQRIDNFYASLGLYSLASLTALHRIYNDKHWFSDTILGAALGTVIGLKVVKLNTSFDDDMNSSVKMNITPMISSDRFGVGMVLQF